MRELREKIGAKIFGKQTERRRKQISEKKLMFHDGDTRQFLWSLLAS